MHSLLHSISQTENVLSSHKIFKKVKRFVSENKMLSSRTTAISPVDEEAFNEIDVKIPFEGKENTYWTCRTFCSLLREEMETLIAPLSIGYRALYRDVFTNVEVYRNRSDSNSLLIDFPVPSPNVSELSSTSLLSERTSSLNTNSSSSTIKSTCSNISCSISSNPTNPSDVHSNTLSSTQFEERLRERLTDEFLARVLADQFPYLFQYRDKYITALKSCSITFDLGDNLALGSAECNFLSINGIEINELMIALKDILANIKETRKKLRDTNGVELRDNPMRTQYRNFIRISHAAVGKNNCFCAFYR